MLMKYYLTILLQHTNNIKNKNNSKLILKFQEGSLKQFKCN